MQTYKIKIPLENLLRNFLPSNIQSSQKKDASLSTQSPNVSIDFSLFPTKMNSSEGKGTLSNVWKFEASCSIAVEIQSQV